MVISAASRLEHVFVSPRSARHEDAGDQNHEPLKYAGRLVILISRVLVRAGRTAGHTNTPSQWVAGRMT
ncbi:MAG TPA: hypothetical protein VEL79_19430 [Vicinamibacterales bacterium]|nr:hypothetical protein [Vicinamibacterales bacterium]